MLEKPAEKVAWESAAFGKTIVFLRENIDICTTLF